MLVRFSKYDFWIPEQILNVYRKNSTKNNFFRDQKILSKKSKNIFRDQTIFGKKVDEKVNEKWKFKIFDFFEKKNEI